MSKKASTTYVLIFALVMGCILAGRAETKARAGDKHQSGASAIAGRAADVHAIDEDTMRFEGEKRYHANCGRCHQAPHKLPPRAMATAIRHMRVRAMLTDEDMRYILWYMTR